MRVGAPHGVCLLADELSLDGGGAPHAHIVEPGSCHWAESADARLSRGVPLPARAPKDHQIVRMTRDKTGSVALMLKFLLSFQKVPDEDERVRRVFGAQKRTRTST